MKSPAHFRANSGTNDSGDTMRVQEYIRRKRNSNYPAYNTKENTIDTNANSDLYYTLDHRRKSRARYNKTTLDENLSQTRKSPYVPNYQREPNTASVEKMLQTNTDLKKELLETCEEMGAKLEKSIAKR